MLISQIAPFVRFARYLKIENSCFLSCIPYDHRLFYVIDGIGKIKIENKLVELQKNGLVLIHSGIEYQLLNHSVEYIAFNFDYTRSNIHLSQPIVPANAKNTDKISVLEPIKFDDTPELNTYLILDHCRKIKDTLSQIVDIYSKSLPYHTIQTGALFTSVLVEILRKSKTRNSSQNGLDLSEIIEYIQEYYYLPIDNKSIAKIFNFHPNYISSEFKRCTGMPLHSYILDHRITKAIELMDSGQYDLKAISSQVGFSDYNYFSRYFTKIVGISPQKYIQVTPNK